MEISLTQNQVALVDEADFEKLNKYKWYATFAKHTKSFYAQRSEKVSNKRISVFMHREILGLKKGDKLQGDHINHDTLDNRRKNLRIVTNSQNMANTFAHTDNASGLKGVSWSKAAKKWKAQIQVGGKHFYLGVFDEKEEAYKAFCKACIKYHGKLPLEKSRKH